MDGNSIAKVAHPCKYESMNFRFNMTMIVRKGNESTSAECHASCFSDSDPAIDLFLS